MPRRWLSVRTYKEEQKTRQEVAEAHLQEDFDFAFAVEKHVQRGRYELSSPETLRPTTSDGGRYKARRKPDLTLLIERPRSSDSVVPNKPLSAARFDGSQIGVAFGSPRHPPQALESIASTMSPNQQHHAFFLHGPLPTQPAKGKKWKIGDFFRPRACANKEPTFYRVQQVDVPETKKLGLPIARTPWRNPKSPATAQDHFEEQTPLPVEGEDSKVVLSSTSAADNRMQHKDNHPLRVTVSDTPLERCSVTSKGVNAAKQSGLLIRRSRDLNPLLIATDAEQKSTELMVPKLTRRATSPTASKYRDTSRICHNGLASSKYSLFPATPTSIRFLSQADSPASARTRSATGPPQFSPTQATPLVGSEGHRTGSEQRLASFLHRCDSPTDSRTSNSTMADNARVSSQNEIFFDIQNFRDSQGQVGQQFEMTRPPSAAVQLARSKSNARRLLQEKLDAKVRDQQRATDEDRAEKTTSIEIDETIAIVESLTSPSRIDPALQRLPQSTYKPELEQDSKQGEVERRPHAMDVESTNTVKSGRKTELKSRLDTLNIDVPSPVLEQVEETTPKTLCSVTPTGLVNQQPAQTALTVAVLTVKSTSSPLETIRNTPSPRPGLPIKDSKYIPLSKYAPRRTTEDLVRQTGLRPVRVNRSNTEDMTTWEARTSSLRRPCLERSSTIPPLNPIPLSNCNNLPPPVLAGPGTRNSPSMVAYVKPTAEVSIARTVSLSRKPSARVIGPKFPTRGAPRKEQAQEEVKEMKVVLGIPVVQEAHKGHKPGLSQEVVLDTATIAPSSPPPPLPSPHMFMKAPGEVPPLPLPVDVA